jgi:hypothetical protein
MVLASVSSLMTVARGVACNVAAHNFPTHAANSATRSWPAGGTGAVFPNVAKGGGYSIIGWSGQTPPYGDQGTANFSVI